VLPEVAAVEDQGPVGYRPPLSSVLPAVGVLVLLAIVFPSESGAIIALGIATVFAIVRLRQLLVLHEDHISVTVLRTRRIPWTDIEGFGPGSSMRGGTVIQTAGGDVHSVAPCSWWGGPANPGDLETLQRILASKIR
jgi:hypothetical protein